METRCLVNQNAGDMAAGHRSASRVSFQTGRAITFSATSWLLRFKTVKVLRSVIARAAATAEVCVLWLCITPAQALEQGQQWDRAEALAHQVSSVRAGLDDAWVAGAKAGQPTEAETKHKQALNQERDRTDALACELNSLRAKLDAACMVGSEAVEAAEGEVKQALEQERRRADALARELSSVRAELDIARTAGQEAAQTAAAQAEQMQTLKRERDRAEALGRELASIRAELDTARAAGLEAAQTAEAAKVGQERAFKEERDKTERLTRELASARKEAEARSALLAAAHAEVLQATEKNKAIAAEQNPALASERAETLARELTSVRAELDTARASGLETAQTAEAAKVGQERALREERDKTERLTRELASARKEAEARSALLAAAHAEVLHVMQTNDAAAAEQKLALARECYRADPLARKLASVGNELEAAKRQTAALNEHALLLTVDSSQRRMAVPSFRTVVEETPSPKQISGEAVVPISQRSTASELPRPEPQATAPKAAPDLDRKVATRPERSTSESAAPGSGADEQRLIARANALLRQADISSARPLLEHALEHGSAQAAFMLAETYDARVLQSWRARGIAADLAKARELYERAQAGGIEDAKERIRTLQ